MSHQTKEISISQIKTKDRFRKDLGDLRPLAESIKVHGLLQPIGVTPKKQLVFGERRLRACRSILKWKKIPARIVDTKAIALAQIDENVLRKNFTVSERVYIIDALHGFDHGGDRRSDQAHIVDLKNLTLKDACKRVGWSTETYRRARCVIENGIPQVVETMDAEKLSISAASELAQASKTDQKACLRKRLDIDRWTAGGIKKQLRRVKSERKRAASQRGNIKRNHNDQYQLYHCRFQNLEKKTNLKPNSVDLICADIPYGDDFVNQVEDLAKFCKRFLKNGGTLVTHLGQHRLPDKLQTLSEYLDYRWTISSAWDRLGCPIHPLKMVTKWIPVAVFSKGNWKPIEKWVDISGGHDAEKEWHPWQRPLPEMEKLISYFSKPNSLIVDPTFGSATTAIACNRVGNRSFIGCDCDRAAVVNAQKRLKAELGSPTIIPISKGRKSKAASRKKVANG